MSSIGSGVSVIGSGYEALSGTYNYYIVMYCSPGPRASHNSLLAVVWLSYISIQHTCILVVLLFYITIQHPYILAVLLFYIAT